MPSQAFLATLGLIEVSHVPACSDVAEGGERPVTPGSQDLRLHVFALAGECGFPELFTYGRYQGRGRKLWARFCREAGSHGIRLAQDALEAA